MAIRTQPWMAAVEIQIMDSLFKTQRPKRVLEWGAGGSTLYWPQLHRPIEEWVAIEHNEAFAEAVRGQTDAKVEVLQLNAPQYWRWAELVAPFNMIIVDGIHRVECLEAARGLLAPRGIVVLHDSGRSAYNVAWEIYPFSEVLYAGEIPRDRGDGYYKHRGIAVFWQDKGVRRKKWNRQHLADAPMPERPSYVPPMEEQRTAAIEEAEPLPEITEQEIVAEIGERAAYVESLVKGGDGEPVEAELEDDRTVS